MKVLASTRYGHSYSWGDPEAFNSIADVVREMGSPGSITGHPRSYFPCAGDWTDGYDVDEDGRAVVAFIYLPLPEGEIGHPGDHIAVVTVGPRNGFRVESC